MHFYFCVSAYNQAELFIQHLPNLVCICTTSYFIFITPVSLSSDPALSDLTHPHLVTILKITPTPPRDFSRQRF